MRKEVFIGLVIALAACGARAWDLHHSGAMISADESVFGIMGLHILRGEAWPVFCYGAHYAGTLVSYIAALVFGLAGSGPWQLKAAVLPFVLGSALLFFFVGKRLGGHAGGIIAALLYAFPPPLVFDYSYSVLGGHAETFFFGLLALLIAFSLDDRPSFHGFLLLGLVSGMGIWILPLVLPYLAFAGVVSWEAFRRAGRRSLLPLLGGGLIGALPLILHNLLNPVATILRLGGRSLDLTSTEVASEPSSSILHALIGRFWGFPSLIRETGSGILSLYSERFPAVGAVLLTLSVFIVLLYLLSRRAGDPGRNRKGLLSYLFLLFFFCLLLGLPRGRHYLPLYTGVVLAAAGLAHK